MEMIISQRLALLPDFKLKFFPNYSIVKASESSSGSYAWHNILKGCDVLLKGAKWRVGCGEYHWGMA